MDSTHANGHEGGHRPNGHEGGAHNPHAGQGGHRPNGNLVDILKSIDAMGDKATLADVSGLFRACLAEARKVHPGREGTGLTAERSKRIDLMVGAFRKALALQMLDHGVDRAAELIMMTSLATFITEINRDLHPGFRARLANALTLAELLT